VTLLVITNREFSGGCQSAVPSMCTAAAAAAMEGGLVVVGEAMAAWATAM